MDFTEIYVTEIQEDEIFLKRIYYQTKVDKIMESTRKRHSKNNSVKAGSGHRKMCLICFLIVGRVKSNLKNEAGILRKKTEFKTHTQNENYLLWHIYKLLFRYDPKRELIKKLYDKMDANFLEKRSEYNKRKTMAQIYKIYSKLQSKRKLVQTVL